MKKSRLFCLIMTVILCLMACEKSPVTEKNLSAENTQEVMGSATSDVIANSQTTEANEKGTKTINEFMQGSAWELGNTQGNLLAQGYVCENEEKVYYQDLNHERYLCVMNSDGTGKQVLLEDVPRAIQVVGEFVYYIDDDESSDTYNRMKRVKKDGTEAAFLGEDCAGSMLVTANEIYYSGIDFIAKMETDGNRKALIWDEKESGDFGWFGIYGDCILTGGVLNGIKILAVKLDGSEEMLLYQDYMFPQIHGDTLYCSGEKGIMTAISLLNGEQKTFGNAYGNRSVCDGERLYFTNGRQICVIDTNEDKVQELYPTEEESSVELYGVANHSVFFSELENHGEEEAVFVFKYMNPETMEVFEVP